MHRKVSFHGQPVVHQGENSFFIFTPVPGTKNNGCFLFHVEDNGRFGMQVVLLPVVIDDGTSVDNGKVRVEIVEFFGSFGTNEHIRDKMLLPGHFVNKSYFLSRTWIGSDVAVKDVCLVDMVEVVDCLLVEVVKDFGTGWLVDLIPVNVFGSFGPGVKDDPSIFGRATSVLAGVNSKGGTVFCLGNPSFLIHLFMLKEFRIGQVTIECSDVGNAMSIRETDFLAGVGSFDDARDLVSVASLCVERRGTAA